jgi:general secretion pathway protein D
MIRIEMKHKGLMNSYFCKSCGLAALLTIAILQAASAQAASRYPVYGIDSRIEQIDFRDVALGDALKILSDQSGLNILASREAASISVTMYLKRVTSMEVIDALAKTYNLWYQRDWESNIVRIYTVKEYRMEEVEFKKEETEIFTMKNAKNALDLAETIKNLFSERVFLSYGRNQNELMTDLTQRFQRFNMIDGRSTLSSGAGGGSGRGGLNTQGGGGNFGSTSINTSSGFANDGVGVRSVGQQEGLSNRQIEIDEQLRTATELMRNKVETQELLTGDAVKSKLFVENTATRQAPIYVGVIKHQNRVLVRTRDLDAMNEIRHLYKQLDTNSSMLMMEVKILSVDLGDGFDSLFDFKMKNGSYEISTLNATGAQLAQNAIRGAAAAFNPALLATVVSENFEARLQLLEKEGRVTELATPTLMTVNQEVSRVFVGKEQPIVTGYESSSSTATGGSIVGGGSVINQPIIVPQTELRAIGTTLLLTPNINADRTVSMQLLVEQSAIGKDQATIPVQVDDRLVDANIDLVQERTFSGTVVAKDATSVAVGGLIEELASNNETKVPFLGDIPLLGFFFREEAQARTRRELVVIMKPYIIGTPSDAQTVSDHFLRENSVHPNALNHENLNVYSNPDREHKGYKLEQPFKEYNNQDSMDRYHWDNPNPRR